MSDVPQAAPQGVSYSGDISAQDAWKGLSETKGAQLVDVRTEAEWNFVGLPDLASLGRRVILCQWQFFPQGQNPSFVRDLKDALKASDYHPGAPLYFLCRSGARSRAAACAMTAAGLSPCFNIIDGFEGALDAHRHRGRAGGWKALGLPWIQS